MWTPDVIHYATGLPVRVEFDRGLITQIAPAAGPTDVYIAPGFIDLQVNGYGGADFASPRLTIDEVMQVTLALDRHGITGYLPTITTNSFETTAHALRTIEETCLQRKAAERRILAIHLEGPYISPHDGPRGAHPREHCRPPSWDEFARWQECSGGRIRIVTLSPEYDEAPAFIRRAVDAGVLVAIGHTSATTQQIAAAVAAGARMSTHLGNGAHPQIRRHPNYIWDQLADDRLTASIIADGHHLPANVIKCFLRMKTAARTVLVSDITGMAGMPPGRYATTLGDVEVLAGGKLVPAGQPDILAGAALTIEHCVANVARSGEVDLAAAVEMASTQPARLLGIEDHALAPGLAGNCVLFRRPAQGPLEIVANYIAGECVYAL